MESAMTFYQIKNKEKHFQKDLLLSVFYLIECHCAFHAKQNLFPNLPPEMIQ